ncbi:MAG: LuxR C-terminal-related transcriptional regulator [Sneathiella sp.]
MDDLSFDALSAFDKNCYGSANSNSPIEQEPSPCCMKVSYPGGGSEQGQKIWEQSKTHQSDFYNTALGILYTLTPAILILDSHRRVVFANREAEDLLERGDVISLDRKGHIFCTDHIAQNFLLQYLMSHTAPEKSVFNDEDGSFLIPKADGWPMVAMVGCDQLDSLAIPGKERGSKSHITLMIRDPHGRHPEQSKKLMQYFGLSGAETSVVGELVKGSSTDEIARKRGVSVVTIRNQLKSAQNKMGVARQSELVSLVLRYIS